MSDAYELPSYRPLGAWVERARCAELVRAGEAKQEWWHPEKSKPGDSARVRKEKAMAPKWAKAICAQCPVMEQCRDHARVNGEKYGIWGGENERSRRGKRGTLHTLYCKECFKPFEYEGTGRPFYCSGTCRNRVWERKRGGRAA